jgi:hypothetical protein
LHLTIHILSLWNPMSDHAVTVQVNIFLNLLPCRASSCCLPYPYPQPTIRTIPPTRITEQCTVLPHLAIVGLLEMSPPFSFIHWTSSLPFCIPFTFLIQIWLFSCTIDTWSYLTYFHGSHPHCYILKHN